MYDEIYDTSLSVFDDQTSEFIGTARFNLTPEAEQKLLSLIEFNTDPGELILSNVEFLPSSDRYTPPYPFARVRRHSILNAMVRDHRSRKHTPIEIELKYDRIARSCLTNNPNRLESAELSNIELMEIRLM